MKLIIFGGTGPTGEAVLQASVQDPGLEVTAFVRTPTKIPKDVRDKVNLIVGDALNEEDVAEAIRGQNAVISCLGNGRRLGVTTVMSQGIMNIVNGMRKHGVQKLASVSVACLENLASKDTKGAAEAIVTHLQQDGEPTLCNHNVKAFLLPGYRVPFFLKNPTADHDKAYNFLRSVKDIQWMALAAPGIGKSLSGGDFKVAINKLPGGRLVAPNDLANFLISTVRNDNQMQEYTQQLVGISTTIPLTEWMTKTFVGRAIIIALSSAIIGFTYTMYG